ncbi:MAG: hypothetical protein PHI59_02125 [Candidatus Omnitrophica bacterium]|nr:hypothetical protein [Candidatus Omnitrophota bacterium]
MRKKYFSVIQRGLCCLAVAGMLLAVSAARAEEEDNERPQIVSGQVVEVDPAGSKITINYRDSSATSLVYMTLYVPSSAVITGGIQDIVGLDDINIGDRLEIEYTGDPMDNPTAKRIKDLDRTNW